MRKTRFWPRLCDRKGVAIEMAMLVMVVLFSFSVLLTTTALLHHDKREKAQKGVAQTVVMEQIAYDFCASAGTGEDSWVEKYPDYEVSVSPMELTVKEKDTKTVLLHVTLQNDAGTYRILLWEEK